MVQIVGVRFKNGGKIYYFDPGEFTLKSGTSVIVETSRGIEMGSIAIENRLIDEGSVVQPLKKVVRVATDEDFKTAEESKKKEAEAFEICTRKIKAHNLDMKLVDVEYTFDGSKILFYFTADGRVDFRELVKDLAGVFRTRIELRQIDVRDEAKMIGSYGICGRNLCCSQFLGDFAPVSIKMAKEQGLSLNPTKISGTCGRLMCCLKYEQEAYEDLLKVTPRQGATVSTPDGKGTVMYVNILKGKVKVSIDGGKEKQLSEYDVKDIKVLSGAHHEENEQIDTEILKTLEE